ncbi:MAG: hypothetical protein GY736_05215 [Sphingomonas sp.]|uniref:hypothetical protein n=1 Tax=Sphingomonas sp. TaxID=28214 RepID=UPI0025910484|nr:hypothetical protein [Sphingomonas sp.]MCP4025698.1 hypothetical protein [Sphingomonas sp.]
MDQDQQRILHTLGTGFTTDEAIVALGWAGSRKGLARYLQGLGYGRSKSRAPYQTTIRTIWTSPHRRDDCVCRCHTGTCGENDMVLAERAIRLVETLRPFGADGIQAIVDLVDRAGVDFARAAVPANGLDDDCPL